MKKIEKYNSVLNLPKFKRFLHKHSKFTAMLLHYPNKNKKKFIQPS